MTGAFLVAVAFLVGRRLLRRRRLGRDLRRWRPSSRASSRGPSSWRRGLRCGGLLRGRLLRGRLRGRGLLRRGRLLPARSSSAPASAAAVRGDALRRGHRPCRPACVQSCVPWSPHPPLVAVVTSRNVRPARCTATRVRRGYAAPGPLTTDRARVKPRVRPGRHGRLADLRHRTVWTGRVAPRTAGSDPGTVRARGCCPERRSPLSRRKSAPTPGAGQVDPAAVRNERAVQQHRAVKEGGTAGAVRRRTAPLGRPRPFSPAVQHRPKEPADERRTDPSHPRSTCPPSSTRCSSCWAARQDLRQVPGAAAPAGPGGPSTRARRPRTAGPAPTTSRPASSRTSSRASRRCRATTSSARPAGTATACPVELAVEKELGFSGKHDIEAYGIAEFNARCRESVLRHVDAFEEMTERMGYWVDTSDPYRTMDARVRRVGLVVAQADPRQGPAGRGLPGRAVLPALRHRAVRPRAGPGLRDRDRPVRLRALPADLRPAAPARPRCWSGRRRRGRWSPTPPSPSTRTSPTSLATDGTETLVVAEPLFEAVLGEGWTVDRHGHRPATWSAGPTSGRSTWSSSRRSSRPARRRTSSCSPTTSPPRTAPAWCTSPPPSARTTWRSAARYGLPVVNPVAARRPLRRRRAAGRRPVLQARRRRPGRGPRDARAAVPARRLRAQLPALLALPHRAASTTRSRPGTSAPPQIKDALLRENEKTNWYPDTIKYGRYGDWLDNNIDWALSREPLLGHAAADLALRRGPPDLRRARWPSSPS